jgi:hypothetical protein
MTDDRAQLLASLVVGFVVLACVGAGSPTPGEASMSPGGSTATQSTTVSQAPSPPSASGSSATVRPAFAEAHVPKFAAGVPPENVPVVFREIGVAGQTIGYSLTAQATASYHCWNPLTQEIDTPKETVTRTVATTVALTSDAGGSIRGALQLGPPRPERLTCLVGYRAVPYAGTYAHVVLADTTNDVSVELGDHQYVGG